MGQNRLVRWDQRAREGVVQEMSSPVVGYAGGKDYARNTNFSCMATSGAAPPSHCVFQPTSVLRFPPHKISRVMATCGARPLRIMLQSPAMLCNKIPSQSSFWMHPRWHSAALMQIRQYSSLWHALCHLHADLKFAAVHCRSALVQKRPLADARCLVLQATVMWSWAQRTARSGCSAPRR